MPHNRAFHPGLHCLPKFLLSCADPESFVRGVNFDIFFSLMRGRFADGPMMVQQVAL